MTTVGDLDSGDLADLRSVARHFVESELYPMESEIQRREAQRGLGDDSLIPHEDSARLMDAAREHDLLGLDVPEVLGGQGYGFLAKLLVVEELNRSIVPFRLAPESPNLYLLMELASSEQRPRYLEPYARGALKAASAFTEPDAGCDTLARRTTARRAGSGWVLNGAKQFVSWAKSADFFVVTAATAPAARPSERFTAFIVEPHTPGVHIGRHISTMGEATPYGVSFEDVQLEDSQRLGPEGGAFLPVQRRLDIRRIEMGARCVGMGSRLVDLMVQQAVERETYGDYLADRQMVQSWIADSVTDLHAATLMVTAAARRFDEGDRDLRLPASMVKTFATEMISRISDRTLQLFGGMGFTKDLPIEFIYRNSRFLRVLEGPSEIHRVQIAIDRLGHPDYVAEYEWMRHAVTEPASIE